MYTTDTPGGHFPRALPYRRHPHTGRQMILRAGRLGLCLDEVEDNGGAATTLNIWNDNASPWRSF